MRSAVNLHRQQLPAVARGRLLLALAAALAAAILCARPAAANFLDGDFVPTTRRAQFQNHRTHWHDVLAAHCPKFGVDRLVGLPLPQPIGLASTDEYKLQLSFDGEQHITPWLHLIGRGAPAAPYVEVTLVRSGDALRSVGAAVYELTPQDQEDHAVLVQEFRNASHWPKHLLVSYTWASRHEVDAQRGLLVLFGAGAAVAALAVLSAARAHRQKLRQFLADVTSESVGGAAAPLGKTD